MTKAAAFRSLLNSGRFIRVMGGHNGLTAKLIEKNGFDAAWASSFEISTSYGLPDASILTMTEFLAAAQAMNEAVDMPIIADCDSGFGDSDNVAHMVRKYEGTGIAAVCVEDKPFPKLNSFIEGQQKLVSIEEFTAKIAAGCRARKSDLVFIARTEALIVDYGVDEALRRANVYADAGADAIVIHSKKREPDEIFQFARRWKRQVPIIAIPTTYYETTALELEKAGYQMVIYANHAIRSAVRAMNETMADILSAGTSQSVEGAIAPMSELFELQGIAKVRRAAS